VSYLPLAVQYIRASGTNLNLLVADLLFQSDMSGANGMLPEASELHLLESIGLMTSSTYHCGEQEYQQQYMVLVEITNTIVSQVRSTLQHPQLARYADQFGDRIAHRLNCLSSLAKGHSWKSSEPRVREEAMRCFDESSAIIVESLATLSMCANVRARAIICCHRLLTCVGVVSVQRIGGILPYLLTHCDASDIDALVQLVVQVMLEYGDAESTFNLVNHFYSDIVNKLSVLCQAFEESTRPSALNMVSNSSLNGDPASPSPMRQSSDTPDPTGATLAQQSEELPQVESDRVAIQKHLLVFINQLLTCHLQRVMLTPERNLPLLQQVLGNILACLNGGTGKISAVASVPLRKLALGILAQLATCWGKPSEAVPQQLVDSYYQLLRDQAFPAVGQMVSVSISMQHQLFHSAMRGSPGAVVIDGVTGSPNAATAANNNLIGSGSGSNNNPATANPAVLSLSDASCLSMFAEVGYLWYQSIHSSQNPPATLQYLSGGLFPALGWPELAISQLSSFLQTEGLAPSAVRENFKKFLKSTIQWA
jgi:hypothetical protein